MPKSELVQTKTRLISHLKNSTSNKWKFNHKANATWFCIFIFTPNGRRALASISYDKNSHFLLLHFIRATEDQKKVIEESLASFDIPHYLQN